MFVSIIGFIILFGVIVLKLLGLVLWNVIRIVYVIIIFVLKHRLIDLHITCFIKVFHLVFMLTRVFIIVALHSVMHAFIKVLQLSFYGLSIIGSFMFEVISITVSIIYFGM